MSVKVKKMMVIIIIASFSIFYNFFIKEIVMSMKKILFQMKFWILEASLDPSIDFTPLSLNVTVEKEHPILRRENFVSLNVLSLSVCS